MYGFLCVSAPLRENMFFLFCFPGACAGKVYIYDTKSL